MNAKDIVIYPDMSTNYKTGYLPLINPILKRLDPPPLSVVVDLSKPWIYPQSFALSPPSSPPPFPRPMYIVT